MFRPQDIEQLRRRGITPEQAESQIKRFATGFPYLKIVNAARPGRGIIVLTPDEEEQTIERWEHYLADGGTVCKFVPASGAASRMFKALYEYANGATDDLDPGSDVGRLLAARDRLPFRADLDATLRKLHGKTLEEMAKEGRNRDIVSAIISPEGMNYGALPKALLKFHDYGDHSRTPLEEQLSEGSQTAVGEGDVVRLHFTVSDAHKALFEERLAEAIAEAEQRTGLKFTADVSVQKPSTDTIAANLDNTPFIEDDKLFFRPGGHGALIENLNAIDATVVFIKNIDNVVPEWRRTDTIRYKQVIGGLLLQVHDRIADYYRALCHKTYTPADLREMVDFLRIMLSTDRSDLAEMHDDELADYLKGKFNRPLRVCGMVRNEGEPGGGPYLAVDPDGSTAPQVLESNQIDPSNATYRDMMAHATHFNPVDLVCYIKDPEGRKYDLTQHVDPATGFISMKSSHGRDLKAMELPGLWNGAMSDWNTVFVEVPITTFNPVKTVNDLLRPMHLPVSDD